MSGREVGGREVSLSWRLDSAGSHEVRALEGRLGHRAVSASGAGQGPRAPPPSVSWGLSVPLQGAGRPPVRDTFPEKGRQRKS